MLLWAFLFLFGIITYTKPTFAVGLILALLPTYLIRLTIFGYPTTFLELVLLVFLLIIFPLNLRWEKLSKPGLLNILIGLFVVSGIISLAISPELTRGLGILKSFILEPVAFFYACRLVLKDKEDLVTPLNLLFLSAVLISLFGILQYYTFIDLPLQFWGSGVEVERITSVFEYPNALALYLAPLISFYLGGVMFSDKIFRRSNLILGLTVMGIALVLTFSRGAWLGVLVSVVFLLILKFPIKKLLPVFLVGGAILLVIPATRERIFLINRDASSSAHLNLMKAAVQKIKTSPVLGNGLFGFRTTLQEQNFQGEILNYPHNIFLNFWVEMGVLGLISFLGLILYSLRNYKLNPNWLNIGAAAFLLTMFVHGLVDVPYFKNDLSILFWFVLSVFYI